MFGSTDTKDLLFVFSENYFYRQLMQTKYGLYQYPRYHLGGAGKFSLSYDNITSNSFDHRKSLHLIFLEEILPFLNY